MKTIKFNDENLKEDEIQRALNKVRGILINSKGQCLLVKYAGLYMLPGGLVDEGEEPRKALEREILEESGIVINQESATEFLRIKSYDRNYYDRKMKEYINRLTDTSFYEIFTDKDIDESRKKLTQSEKENNHQIEFINLSKIRYLVEKNQTDNPKRKKFDREILTVLDEYQKYKNYEKENEER